MRTLTTGVIVAVLLLGVLSSASEEGDSAVERILDAVGARYVGVITMECSFEQESHYLGGETFVQRGTLQIKRPGMMRWDYEQPTRRQFISDGHKLWVYHPDESRAFVMEELDSAAQARLFGFVVGLEDVREDFEVKLAPATDGANEHVRLELVPRQPMSGVERVWVDVDPTDYSISAVTIEDGVGTRTVTKLVDAKTNADIADARFTFTAPDGVDVMPYD